MKGLFQCPPWARGFWAFSPYLNHMRNFNYFKVQHLVSPQNYAFFLKRPNKKRENWLIDIHNSFYHIMQIPQPAVCRLGDDSFCSHSYTSSPVVPDMSFPPLGVPADLHSAVKN